MSISLFRASSASRRKGGAPAGVPSALWANNLTGADPFGDFKFEVTKYPERVTFPATSGSPDGKTMQVAFTAGSAEPGFKGRSRFHNAAGLSSPGVHLNIGEQTEVTLSYQVYVPSASLSGILDKSTSKWPGLIGVPPEQDGWYGSTGGAFKEDSFSSRVQIVRGSDFSGGSPYIIFYVYAAYANGIDFKTNPFYGSGTKYGIWIPLTTDGNNDLTNPMSGRNVRVPADRWFEIKKRIVLNTPGENNGILQGWVDGVLHCDVRDVRWRQAGYDTKINQLDMEAFVSNDETAISSGYINFARIQLLSSV